MPPNRPKRPPAKQQKKKGARGVSGNPAKRNAVATQGGDPAEAASAFGAGAMDQAALEKAMADFQLPPELRGRLGQ